MMQKLSLYFIVLLTIVIAIFFPIAGFAGSEVSPPCQVCDNWQYGLQIEYHECSGDMQPELNRFDYEQGCNGGGYLVGQAVNGVVFKLCDCENLSEFQVGGQYGLRIEIVAPADGVYFSAQNLSSNKYASCQNSIVCNSSNGYLYLSSYVDSGAPYCPEPCAATPVAFSYESSSASETLYDPDSELLNNCCFSCGDTDYRVKSIKTSCTASFIEADKPILLIDLPTFVYDPSLVNPGITSVTVNVMITDSNENNICSCLVNVGEFVESPTFVVSPAISRVGSGAEILTLTVDTSGDNYVSWSAVSESDWMTVSGTSSGTDFGEIIVNVEPNEGFFRSGEIVVTSAQAVNSPQVLSVNQYPDDLLLLSPLQRNVAAAGGTVTLSVETTGDRYVTCNPDINGSLACRVDTTSADYIGWHATSDSDWLEISGDPYGVGFGSVVAEIAANDGSIRSAHITITSPEAHNSPQVFTVKQMGTSCTQITEMAGLSTVSGTGYGGILPKLNYDSGWTGIVLVNSGVEVAHVSLTVYDDTGGIVASINRDIAPRGKIVGTIENFFTQDISLASYLSYSSDQPLASFYLGGYLDGRDFEALPIPLEIGEDLYFPALTSGDGWVNEFAVINSTNEMIHGDLVIYDGTGSLIYDETVVLSPFGRKQWTMSETGASINLAAGEYTARFIPTAQVMGLLGYVAKTDGLSHMSFPALSAGFGGDLYLPRVQPPGSDMWQGLVLVNTAPVAAELSIEGEGIAPLPLVIPAYGLHTVVVADLFSGSESVYPNHLMIRNPAGIRICGYEMVGNYVSAAAVQLHGFDDSMNIFYPHIYSIYGWNTDFVAFNNSEMAEVLSLESFGSTGNSLLIKKYYLAGKESLVGLSSIDLPPTTTWFKIESTGPVFGYELLKYGNSLCPENPADLDGDQDGDGADLARLAQRLIDGNVSPEELEVFAAAFGRVR